MVRISLIQEMFPDARFIFIYRDPYKAVESFYRFFNEILPAVQVQDAKEALSRERLTRIYADMIRQYQVEKCKISPDNLVEIRFEDFKKNPLEDLEKIFTHLRIPGYTDALPHFKSYLEDVSEFRQTKYEVTSETIRGINEHAGDLVDLLGYPVRDQ